MISTQTEGLTQILPKLLKEHACDSLAETLLSTTKNPNGQFQGLSKIYKLGGIPFGFEGVHDAHFPPFGACPRGTVLFVEVGLRQSVQSEPNASPFVYI